MLRFARNDKGYACRDKGYAARDKGYAARDKGYAARDKGCGAMAGSGEFEAALLADVEALVGAFLLQ